MLAYPEFHKYTMVHRKWWQLSSTRWVNFKGLPWFPCRMLATPVPIKDTNHCISRLHSPWARQRDLRYVIQNSGTNPHNRNPWGSYALQVKPINDIDLAQTTRKIVKCVGSIWNSGRYTCTSTTKAQAIFRMGEEANYKLTLAGIGWNLDVFIAIIKVSCGPGGVAPPSQRLITPLCVAVAHGIVIDLIDLILDRHQNVNR